MPWLSDPVLALERLQETAPLASLKPPALGTPVLRVEIGRVGDLGPYSSPDRHNLEAHLLDTLLSTLHPHVHNAHFLGGTKNQGTRKACIELQFLETDEAIAAKQQLADAGVVDLTYGDRA